MSTAMWDERYSAQELVWSATPNQWVEELTADLPPGRVLDLAAGEGRNALWLAERGWDATAVDFSQVGLDRAQQLAGQRLGSDAPRLRTVCADLLTYAPAAQAYDLVLVVYLHLPAEQRGIVMRAAAAAVAPRGRLIVIAHDTRNLTEGIGGPQDPAVLYTAADLTDDIDGSGLAIERATVSSRAVQTDAGTREALDAILVARRP
ncbi:MAG: class I SAM-dependent methyltransferase [Candidatus Nanopelagicales bacterium]|nr:class I SAM-dependent methyltransferase [Candidatus Nanopelagicales bacterium]